MVPGDPEAVSVATAGRADSRDLCGPPRPALRDRIPRAEAATSRVPGNPKPDSPWSQLAEEMGEGGGRPSSIRTGVWPPLALCSHTDLGLVSPFLGMLFLCRIGEKGLWAMIGKEVLLQNEKIITRSLALPLALVSSFIKL